MNELNRVDTIIIGAGPSGLSAASVLKKHEKSVFILEKEAQAGGKCHTFTDSLDKNNKTEWGAALIAPNYGKVIDKMQEKQLVWEQVLPSDLSTLPFDKNLSQMSLLEKGVFGLEFTNEVRVFAMHAKKYQNLRDKHQDLPAEYKIPFKEFAKQHHLEKINEFSYIFVPAFGYGLMEECPTYAVLEYYGTMTLPDLIVPKLFGIQGLRGVQNGFQELMEAIAADFDISYKSNIQSITRNDKGVTVVFESDGVLHSISANSLVLAISPLYWPKLGMELTETEQQCVDNLSWYQYPVAVVKLHGFPANHYYEYKGLTSEGLEHLALITTRDNRVDPKDGRLCTAYINLKSSQKNKSTDFVFTPEKIKQLKDELLQVPSVTGVDILETKVWNDYMSTLPWELRLELDKKQMEAKTLHVGPYALGGFEDVACVWEQSHKATKEYILQKQPKTSSLWKEVNRNLFFFSSANEKPYDGPDRSVSYSNSISG
ncbi:protoporphyrinogen oxidase [Legionella gratiana]|uniref:Tryptophan 2-monooxygenase n=1 Tax=Legionella gratiana TaxID=45066 RepID=A0A378J1T2_9GAMM|nr:NAD(P)/FAD-dependent oxidoreductase [Legionella gratiana]KTD11675.1 protoporphyrinogen oxidase [Legionella gratiana]STX40877.1 protoporphyrinogen oxidase [Legionella gratiana]